MINKIKANLNRINKRFFYGRYIIDNEYFNSEASLKSYIFKFIVINTIFIIVLSMLFNDYFLPTVLSFMITIFYINEIISNSKKLKYDNYILSQLSIYTNQVSMLISNNNVYSSLENTKRYLSYPLNEDLEKVLNKINEGETITESFAEFNKKYNNKIITLFNQTLELFDSHGGSDSNMVLHMISEEMNMLKIKKDKYLKFKKEWRLNFYVVVFLCLSMPIIMKLMIPAVYFMYMNSFGKWVITTIMLISLFVIKKVEALYRNQNIGEGGSC